jgi:hypothetical protein
MAPIAKRIKTPLLASGLVRHNLPKNSTVCADYGIAESAVRHTETYPQHLLQRVSRVVMETLEAAEKCNSRLWSK